ncbi:MAG: SgcJ/EcaC family oxidoreductase [bacterium]|nr:SgcJ/EcaC family oxidoreductase [bacterium]
MTTREKAQAPTDVDRLFAERVNAGDVDGVVALYEPTGTLIRQDRSSATGHAAIRDEIAALVAMRPAMVMNVHHVVTGGDVALLYNAWQATLTPPGGGEPITLAGRAREVVRRQADGTWLFVIDDPDTNAE